VVLSLVGVLKHVDRGRRSASLSSRAVPWRNLLVSARQQWVFRCVSTEVPTRRLLFRHGIAIGSIELTGCRGR